MYKNASSGWKSRGEILRAKCSEHNLGLYLGGISREHEVCLSLLLSF